MLRHDIKDLREIFLKTAVVCRLLDRYKYFVWLSENSKKKTKICQNKQQFNIRIVDRKQQSV